MEYLVTAGEMKKYDSNTIERIGIPSMVLMERASMAICEQIVKRFPEGGTALIAVGGGNNGADGLALARLLAKEGWGVDVWELMQNCSHTTEYEAQLQILRHYPVRISSFFEKKEYTVIVDAVFGVGLSRPVTGEAAEHLDILNRENAFRVSVDIPSGISADDGRILGTAFRADLTVTFGFAKRGLYFYPGASYAGTVVRAQIGIGPESFFGEEPKMYMENCEAAGLLPIRPAEGNKGTFGKLLVIAGFEQMAGAAALAAKAAYRTGAGMVKVICAPENRTIVQGYVPEVLYGFPENLEASLDWADAVVIGPGLGKSEAAQRLLHMLLLDPQELPVVIDADALNLIAEKEVLAVCLKERCQRKGNVILTPHVGELARLLHMAPEEIKRSPVAACERLIGEYDCTLVAKDARTMVCRRDYPIFLNTAGNCGMATAGSGDVLCGIIGGLAAQSVEPFRAAADGVRLHALAGDAAKRVLGEHGIMAGDLAAWIGR